MFTVIDNEKEIAEIEAGARTRGATHTFLKDLTLFYAEHKQDYEGKPFMVYLNKSTGDPFYGKQTDSLYTSLNAAINKLSMKQEWRLIKRKQADDTTVLIIAKL